jgi:broad specificity phosphatase PhoE
LKSKKIYLIRHGQTDFNKNGVVQGSGVDAPLNQEGERQADAFFKRYHNIPFDKIYTSVLQRTIQSVQGFLDLGIPHEKLEGLNEISWGVMEGIPFTPDNNSFYIETLEGWRKGIVDVAVKGGESPLQVKERLAKAMEYIVSEENAKEETVLICMHGRAMRILLCHLLNYPLHAMDLFEHVNLCLYVLTYEDGKYRLDAYNHQDHLQ